MNGAKILLDANAVLAVLGEKFDLEKISDATFIISFVTELELISYPNLTEAEEKVI